MRRMRHRSFSTRIDWLRLSRCSLGKSVHFAQFRQARMLQASAGRARSRLCLVSTSRQHDSVRCTPANLPQSVKNAAAVEVARMSEQRKHRSNMQLLLDSDSCSRGPKLEEIRRAKTLHFTTVYDHILLNVTVMYYNDHSTSLPATPFPPGFRRLRSDGPRSSELRLRRLRESAVELLWMGFFAFIQECIL